MRPDPERSLREAELLVAAGDLRGILPALERFTRSAREWARERGLGAGVDPARAGSYADRPEPEIVRGWNRRVLAILEAIQTERRKTLQELETLRRSRRFGEADDRPGRWVEDRA